MQKLTDFPEPLSKNETSPRTGNDVTETYQNDIFTVNVRGNYLQVEKSLLEAHPLSTLYQLAQGHDGQGEEVLFINRNPVLVPYLRDYYYEGQLHLPDGVCPILLHEEVAFWGIPFGDISECCTDKTTAASEC